MASPLMQSQAAGVDQYPSELPNGRRRVPEQVRKVIPEDLPKGYEGL